MFGTEIGDMHRAAQLSSWTGLTPRRRESDTVEAVQRHPTTTNSPPTKTVSNLAAANTSPRLPRHANCSRLVYCGRRDGHIRALERARAR